MLPLDDPFWAELDHAYGKARDTPDLLRELALSPEPQDEADTEPWYSLWSSICHQDTAYTASYAAVPHIIQIARNYTGPIHFSFLLLPAAVEVARHRGRGPAIPERLSQDYHRALARLSDCVSIHRHERWDRSMLISAAGAQAVAKGDIELAEAILNLDEEWIAKINAFEFD